LLINAEPVLNENHDITHIICSINDITERKKLEQKLLTEKISQQRLLTQATLDGQEKERKEIGKELHDNIGQQLTTTKLFLDLAKTTADDNTNEMISLALKGISDVINEVRRMSRALVPPTLGDLGLVDSINDLIDSISRAQYLKIEFNYFDFNEDFVSDNKKLMLFRIIQEQLNNIVKHANAKNVTINLSDKESYLLLEVKDDGQGFNIKNIRKGLGLTNIRNRAELFGGTMHITSIPQQGCCLQVSIPDLFKETVQ
jgi:signal transduction histidine kinase